MSFGSKRDDSANRATLDSSDASLAGQAPTVARLVSGPRGALLWAAALPAVACLLYWDLFRQLIHRWNVDPNCSHGFLVIPCCVALAWRGCKRTRFTISRRLPRRCIRIGLLSLFAGIVLHIESILFSSLLFGVIGLVFTTRGCLWIFGGRRAVRACGFASLYLMFMAPLPFSLRQPLLEFLQSLVSVLSADVLELSGMPIFRDGILLHLPGLTLEVAEGCSGMRQLTAFLAVSAAIAGWCRMNRLSSFTLCLAAVPIAVISNALRIVLTGFVYRYCGAEWAEGVFHTVEGLVVVVLGAAPLLWVASMLVGSEAGTQCSLPRASERADVLADSVL